MKRVAFGPIAYRDNRVPSVMKTRVARIEDANRQRAALLLGLSLPILGLSLLLLRLITP